MQRISKNLVFIINICSHYSKGPSPSFWLLKSCAKYVQVTNNSYSVLFPRTTKDTLPTRDSVHIFASHQVLISRLKSPIVDKFTHIFRPLRALPPPREFLDLYIQPCSRFPLFLCYQPYICVNIIKLPVEGIGENKHMIMFIVPSLW